MPPRRSARLETAKAALRDSLAQLPATGSEAPHSTDDGDPSPADDGQPASGLDHYHHVLNLANDAAIAIDHFKRERRSTPFELSTSKSSTERQPVRVQRNTLIKVIGGPTTSSVQFVAEAFGSAFPNTVLRKWLRSEQGRRIYGAEWSDKKKKSPNMAVWKLPRVATYESEIYGLLLSILKAIVDSFVKPGLASGVKREVHDVHNVLLTHKDGKQHTSPDIVVCGTDSCFEMPSDGKSFGYANILTFFEVKLDEVIALSEHLKQIAIYAQQIFAHQPNRLFVEGLLISEKHFQLVRFDRAGVQVSPFISLNERPFLFIRTVIGLCGGEGSRTCFDDTIQWSIVNGKKSAGTLRFGASGQEEIFDLVHPHPISHSFDVRGRANTVWMVRRRGTELVFFVKDSWMPEGRTPEHELLDKAGAILGVGKMASFHVRDIRTRDFRCETTLNDFSDRQASRILLRPYRREIKDFTDVLEVLRALHDAICAHLGLFTVNILHRDISHRNVLLGNNGARKGWRGVLIDLGAALDFGPSARERSTTKEARSGNRFFQSCMILRYLTRFRVGEAPPHDHLDDLEGIFYLTSFLMFQFNPNGTERHQEDVAREVVHGWDSEDAKISLAMKLSLLNSVSGMKDGAADILRKSWGPACATLFMNYRKWVCDIQNQKAQILEERERRRAEIDSQSECEKTGSEMVTGSHEVDDGVGKKEGNDVNLEEGEDKFKTVEDLFTPTVIEPQVPLEQGVFAPLLDSASEHYTTVLEFFRVAIASIEEAQETQGPPSIHRQAAKRKSSVTGECPQPKRVKIERA